jgi:hypothetical protein
MGDFAEIFKGLQKAHNPVYMAVSLKLQEGAT